MKPALERTAILSRDLTEQPPGPYLVMLPDINVVLTADSVDPTDTATHIWQGNKLIASFSPMILWVMLDMSRVEAVSRASQLKRFHENQKAEEGLSQELSKQDEEIRKKNGVIMGDKVPGVYL